MTSSRAFANRLEQRLDWARDQVGVPPSASLDEVRQSFFAALEDENLTPDEILDRAFRTLRWEAEGIIDAEDPPEFLAAEECDLREEVDKFAAEMFSLPTFQRRERWSDLHQRAAYAPRLQARLEILAPGLDVDLGPLAGGDGEMHLLTLARYAMELFPLRPTARAVRRHTLLQTIHKDELKPWRKAAQALKKKYPHLAALAPELIDPLASPASTPRRSAPTAPTPRKEGSARGAWAGLALAAAIFGFFIVRAGLQSSPSPPNLPSSPFSSPFRYTPPDDGPIRPVTPPSSSHVDEILRKLREDMRRHEEERDRWMREVPKAQPPTWPPNRTGPPDSPDALQPPAPSPPRLETPPFPAPPPPFPS